MNTRTSLSALFLCLAAAVSAQVSFTEAPSSWQLYPRVGSASTAKATIRGKVAASSGIVRLSAKLSRLGSELDTDQVTLNYTGDSAAFVLELDVPVRRADHLLEIFADDGSGPERIRRASHVVAGDVYVVNGQSNALANISVLPADRDDFVRGFNSPFNGNYGAAPGWALVSRTYAGVWAGRTARLVSQELDVPIAVFNFAEGGKKLDHFEPGHPDGNYDRVLDDLATAGVLGKVRAFFWSQGENNGYDNTTLQDYRARLTTLFARYRQQFGTDDFYLHQTRPRACRTQEPVIPEAQRRLARQLDYVTLVGTTNLPIKSDGCHYVPEAGYGVQGERLADLLLVEEYGRSQAGVQTPTLDSARVTGSREITVYMTVPGSSLATTGSPWDGFVAEGVNARAIAGSVSGERITLTFATDIAAATGLTYESQVTTGNSYIHNARGVGIVTWYDVSLVPGDGAAERPVDLELSLQASTASVSVGGRIDVTAELYNAGGTTVTDALLLMRKPASLDYAGARPYDASDGELIDPSLRWTFSRLRPGERATLTVSYRVTSLDADAVVHAQVERLDQTGDPDSVPGNRNGDAVAEDDEARLVLNDRSLDCQLRASILSSECGPETDSLAVWMLGFDASDVSNGPDVELVASPAEALLYTDVGAQRLALSFDTLASRGVGQAEITIRRNTGAYGCEVKFTDLVAPSSCEASDPGVTPPVCDTIALDSAQCFVRRCDGVDSLFCIIDTTVVTPPVCDTIPGDSVSCFIQRCDGVDSVFCTSSIDDPRHTPDVAFVLAPNPTSAGSYLRIELQATPPSGLRYTVADLAGRQLLSDEMRSRTAIVDTSVLRAGVYVVRVGNTAKRLLILSR